MRLKIFLRFFSVTLLSVILMFAVGIAAVTVNTEKTVEERLKVECELATLLIENSDSYEPFEYYKDNNEYRITVFNVDGDVLYDSDTKAQLENHKNREEIQSALSGHPAAVKRFSETFGYEMTYYAVRVAPGDGEEIVLRLAIKSSTVSSYVLVAIPLLITVLIGSLVISMLLSGLFAKNVSDKISDVHASLKNLNDGKYTPIISNSSEPELYAIFNEINDLNANIHLHIHKAEREKQKLNSVLDNVSQSIIAIDKKQAIVFANKSAESLFPNDAEGGSRPRLMSFIGDEGLYRRLDEQLPDAASFTYEYQGKVLRVVLSRIIDRRLTEDISHIIIITDITKEKLVEQQKSDFFQNASHELKTPITVLQGTAELLLASDELGEAEKKKLDRIHRETLRLASLISDMMKISQLEGGEAIELKECEISLDALISEALSELSAKIEEKNITVRQTGDVRLLADPDIIYELIENILSNAVRYNKPSGTVDVSVTDGGSFATLEVLDSGIGIESEHIPRLCERFYRVDKSHSKKTGGTGLGLAIVKHICALYSAELKIESEAGSWTRVTVLLPKSERKQ